MQRLYLFHRAGIAMVFLMLAALIAPSIVTAEPSFVTPNFKAKWQRADKPVQDAVSNPARSWLWGPEGFSPASGNQEQYNDSPNGVRQVQYFDKARMELNNPANGLVTNGLLVRELISGRLATGDNAFISRRSADDIPVAGDPTNNNGPTYASFGRIASLNNDNPAQNRNGQVVNEYLDRNGNITTGQAPNQNVKYAYYEDNLKHNIPNVFWDFMNQRGNVYVNGQLVANQPVLGDNPLAPWLDATGFPITDSYWTYVTLAGKSTVVLVQAFERRVLTYTSSNPAGFQVEMGNVGRHYFNWRYDSRYDAPASIDPQPGVTSCAELPKSSLTIIISCGPAGMPLIFSGKVQSNETVIITPYNPGGDGQRAYSIKADGSGNFTATIETTPQFNTGMWTYKFKGQSSNTELAGYIWTDPPTNKPTVIASLNTARMDQTIYLVSFGFDPEIFLNLSLKTPKNITVDAIGNFKTTANGSYVDVILPNRDINPPSQRVAGEYRYIATSKKDGKFAFVDFTLIN